MSDSSTVYVVDDSVDVRKSLTVLLRSRGLHSHCFPNARTFLKACPRTVTGCLIADVRMPGPSGLDLQDRLRERGYTLPVIIITAHADVPMAVRALQAGAIDFLEKPLVPSVLIPLIEEALVLDARCRRQRREKELLSARFAQLTVREREILRRIVQGRYNKMIAADLDISLSTVEVHRRRIVEKLNATSLYDLVRIAELNLDLDAG